MTDVYITNYALSEGILRGKTDETIHEPNVFCYLVGPGKYQVYCKPGQCHLTWEGALKSAEEMRRKKLASLEKSIEKVKAIEFREPKHD